MYSVVPTYSLRSMRVLGIVDVAAFCVLRKEAEKRAFIHTRDEKLVSTASSPLSRFSVAYMSV